MDIREQVIWALSNIARNSEQSKDVIIDSGCVDPLVEDLSSVYSFFIIMYSLDVVCHMLRIFYGFS